ncbi:MAG TPA: DUF1697 domain-containing protein [Gemmatales bacterium]|nr:DUF1697 domain-containing protein [Gemmatales bacterium]
MSVRCVALLRGINVGKAKRVAMADLRALMEKLGYSDVKTLLNSGNVVFTVPGKVTEHIASQIEKSIASRLGVETRVFVVSAYELNQMIQANPLWKVADNPSRYLLAIVDAPGDMVKLKPLLKEDWGADALAHGKRAAYLWCASGILESKLLSAFSKALKDGMTTRNWATILKLQAMMETI